MISILHFVTVGPELISTVTSFGESIGDLIDVMISAEDKKVWLTRNKMTPFSRKKMSCEEPKMTNKRDAMFFNPFICQVLLSSAFLQ